MRDRHRETRTSCAFPLLAGFLVLPFFPGFSLMFSVELFFGFRVEAVKREGKERGEGMEGERRERERGKERERERERGKEREGEGEQRREREREREMLIH